MCLERLKGEIASRFAAIITSHFVLFFNNTFLFHHKIPMNIACMSSSIDNAHRVRNYARFTVRPFHILGDRTPSCRGSRPLSSPIPTRPSSDPYYTHARLDFHYDNRTWKTRDYDQHKVANAAIADLEFSERENGEGRIELKGKPFS